jgi:hypothetical protein
MKANRVGPGSAASYNYKSVLQQSPEATRAITQDQDKGLGPPETHSQTPRPEANCKVRRDGFNHEGAPNGSGEWS